MEKDRKIDIVIKLLFFLLILEAILILCNPCASFMVSLFVR